MVRAAEGEGLGMGVPGLGNYAKIAAMRLKSGARNLRTTRARALRKEMSVSEKVAWVQLRNEKLGFKVRRQHPVGPYILDFYCPEAKVCVEIDGEQHQLRQESDARRDKAMSELEC